MQENQKQVIRSHAVFLLKAGSHEKAALQFASSDISFDEAVITIIQSKSPLSKSVDSEVTLLALRVYLIQVLKILSPSSKSQRTMVGMWLCEIYLHSLETQKLANGRVSDELLGEFRTFVRTNK